METNYYRVFDDSGKCIVEGYDKQSVVSRAYIHHSKRYAIVTLKPMSVKSLTVEQLKHEAGLDKSLDYIEFAGWDFED